MDELICSECKGRKFRKISDSEYECEYCGAVIKDTSYTPPPQVIVVNSEAPQQVDTPFPKEISYNANLKEGLYTLVGQLIILPDKFVFKVLKHSAFYFGNLSPREWNIIDISECIKGILFNLKIKMRDNTSVRLEVHGGKRIINELVARRKYLLEKKK